MEFPSIAQVVVGVLIAGAVGWMLMQRRNVSIGSSRRQFDSSYEDLNRLSDDRSLGASGSSSSRSSLSEMSGLHYELFEQIRDWKAELDSKAFVLQSLIRICGEESDRLERLISEVHGVGTTPHSGSSFCSLMDKASPPETKSNTEMTKLVDLNLMQEVYRLADLGKSLPQIALSMNRSEFDIEFLMNLRSPR